MKRKYDHPRILCEKCGRTAPVDHERSTAEVTVYDLRRPCPCGGRWCTTFDPPKEGGGRA